MDNEGNISEYIYTELSQMEGGHNFYTRMAEYRENILNVKVVDYIKIPDNAYKTFDVSKNQDGSIMAWMLENETNNGYYDLYIGGNDGVKASVSCQNIFAELHNCITIDLEDFYTEDTTNFNYMFMNCKKLISINLENLNTSNAASMNCMFASCNSLKEIDVTRFDTSKVKDMAAIFSGTAIITIDLNNFVTTKVTAMNQMFRDCYKLEILDLSNFDTSSLTRTDLMFYNNSKLKTIYVSDKWTNDKVTLSSAMFQNCSSLAGNINYDSSKTDISYANYENGYFTYKE